MKVVSPFRPFPPESPAHQRLGAFDWVSALLMLRQSVTLACGCPTYAITDVDTTLPLPAYQYRTEERRLMLWMLEVALRYLESPDFDDDTVMACPDLLVHENLARFFTADLGLLVRGPKFMERPILNTLQFWRVAAKQPLVAFFTEARAIAATLPDSVILWGADSEPLRQLVEPMARGSIVQRHGLSVAMWPHDVIMREFSSVDRQQLLNGETVTPPCRPVTDFKYTRKHFMRAYYTSTIGTVVLT